MPSAMPAPTTPSRPAERYLADGHVAEHTVGYGGSGPEVEYRLSRP
jgi:hypothetical protein